MQNFSQKINKLIKDQKPVQLHLGCGKRVLPYFLHVDIEHYPHIDLVSKVEDLSAIPDNSVDLIYACHVIEYFDFIEVDNVLKEWYRVLKINATLRLSVPDFEKVIKVYQLYGEMNLLYGFLYGRHSKLNSDNKPIFHKMIYTLKTLEEYLFNAGFKSIKSYDWRDTIHKDFDDYSQAYIPHMEKKTGLLMSHNVEAGK